MPDLDALRQMQSLPLEVKVHMSQARIREWYEYWQGNVYVSFSGGKDSTVLAHLVREYYPDVPLVFSNTGLEYPEVRQFAKKLGAETVQPEMSFADVIREYGYPLVSKEVSQAIFVARRIRNGTVALNEKATAQKSWVVRKREELQGKRVWEENPEQRRNMYNKEKWLPLCRDTQFRISNKCCDIMKKHPMHKYARNAKLYPYIGTLTEESKLREQKWLQNGCNAYDADVKSSQPLSFWTEQDILAYIKSRGLEIASVYGSVVNVDDSGFEYNMLPGFENEGKLKCTGCERTGCVYCAFGAHLNGDDRFVRLAKTHPKQYEYCMGGGQWIDNPDYDSGVPKMDGDWENWNPKKIWVPSKEGLGMRKVFEDMNALYGKNFIRFE